VKFLVDECLSPGLATLARERGHPESTHVTWLGLTSAQDWTIARRAVDDSFVLVTNNAADFTALYGREELHAGLVCLNAAPGVMSLDLQRRLFLLAMAELGGAEGPTTRSWKSRPRRQVRSRSAGTACPDRSRGDPLWATT
jgi:predicted nuclease of predicted toxin-antitoxin system